MARSRWLTVTVALGLAGCGAIGGPHHPPMPVADGTLAGVIRSADTGAAIDDAMIVVRRRGQLAPVLEPTNRTGAYQISRLTPGRYQVTVYRDHHTIGDEQVTILAGLVTGLDLVVGSPLPPIASPDRPAIEVAIAGGAPLWRYQPADADPHTGTVEGTVTEQGQRTRLGGAVVTIADRAGNLVADAVSDDSGRYRCASLPPGSYVVSAYYTLLGRGQFEIRRSDVTIAGGDVVVVPLAIETEGG